MNIVPRESSNNVASTSRSKGSDEAFQGPINTPFIRRGNVVEKWIKKFYTKNNGQGKQDKAGVQTNNSFAGLENVVDEEKGLVTVSKNIKNGVEHDLGDAKKGTLMVEDIRPPVDEGGSMVGIPNLDCGSMEHSSKSFQVLLHDFQEDIGAVCQPFTVSSVPFSPKVEDVSCSFGSLQEAANQIFVEFQVSAESLESILSSPRDFQKHSSGWEKDAISGEVHSELATIEKAGESPHHVE
ncbi:hypothetical protein LIER_29508 [Lithospermum erythrorhizon]|uniref:Uncharacterized protein n=1 Tax=Lithospermum erythrorhizon TaxID=34254 RepID=A0AAV3RGW7_LITER